MLAPLLLALSILCSNDAPPTGLTSSEKSQATKIIKRYFAEVDAEKRAAILAELEPLDHPSAADIRRFQRSCFKLARTALPAQKGKSPYRCLHPDHPGEYVARVPSKAKKGTRCGVFIVLHGSSGSGPKMESWWGLPDSKLICVFPTVESNTGGWNRPAGERFVTAILDELKRSYRIDTNRVYIAGHSMGGYGTWSIGGKHADLFAAAGAMAGGTWEPGVVPNFRNLPLWVYNAEDDPKVQPASSIRAFKRIDEELRPRFGGFQSVFHLYPPSDGLGHGIPKKSGHDLRAIFDWMLKHERDPRPARVVWEPSLAWKRRFYWVGCERGSGVIDVRREGNRFTVADGRGDVWIYLNDELCDLKKEIVILAAKAPGEAPQELKRELAQLSLRVLVESIGLNNDPEMSYVARIRAR